MNDTGTGIVIGTLFFQLSWYPALMVSNIPVASAIRTAMRCQQSFSRKAKSRHVQTFSETRVHQ